MLCYWILFIQELMKEFPDSEIHSITELGEVNSQEETINTKIKKEK